MADSWQLPLKWAVTGNPAEPLTHEELLRATVRLGTGEPWKLSRAVPWVENESQWGLMGQLKAEGQKVLQQVIEARLG